MHHLLLLTKMSAVSAVSLLLELGTETKVPLKGKKNQHKDSTNEKGGINNKTDLIRTLNSDLEWCSTNNAK